MLTVMSVSGAVLLARDDGGQVHRFQLAPAVGVHENHPTPRANDWLIVRLESSAITGDTLVATPCGCSILLLDGHVAE